MKEPVFILRGNIVYSKSVEELCILNNGYLVCRNGVSEGVFEEIPSEFNGFPVKDYGDRIIMPGLTDLHVHAPQYAFCGSGMDLELLDWLNTYTFPEEAKYEDTDYAQRAYRIFTDNLRRSAVTRACIFATIHRKSTLILMDMLEQSGLSTMVGKVNMDRNSPEYLCEISGEESASETVEWIKDVMHRHYKRTFPIITPRFTPACSDELMEKLKMIQLRYGLPVQSHLSENPGEVAWVKELCPWAEFYGDAYDRFGLFGADCKTVMAHCVYSEDNEIERMKENGVFIAHCPESNMNLSSGIAPVRRFLQEGMHVGLGSDIGAGTTENIFQAMAHAIRASKLRWRIQDPSLEPLTIEEVIYMGTKGGGEFFGKTGSFEPGYEFDAVVIDDARLKHPQDIDVKTRLERIIYNSDDREVYAKYVNGNQLF